MVALRVTAVEGKGAPQTSTVFKRRDTFPDFTDCAGTTPEPNGNWKAVIVHGGPSRGLSQIMPAFGDLLTDEQINDVIAYMRGFCKNVHHDPLGELNLPRAISHGESISRERAGGLDSGERIGSSGMDDRHHR